MAEYYWCDECGGMISGEFGHRPSCSHSGLADKWVKDNAWQAKEDAIAEAEEHANSAWRETALAVVWNVARYSRLFTTDLVWADLAHQPVATHEPRAMGAIMQAAAREGTVRATERYWPSTRAKCHGRPVRVWESRIYQREERTA